LTAHHGISIVTSQNYKPCYELYVILFVKDMKHAKIQSSQLQHLPKSPQNLLECKTRRAWELLYWKKKKKKKKKNKNLYKKSL